jgi:RNA polymerase sigma factor (sigma-70 family)
MPKKNAPSTANGPGMLGEFLRCKAGLRRVVSRIVKPHDIDDILQETFIRACAAADRTDIRHPRSFMLKTAQNLALNHITSAYSRTTQLEDFSVSDVSLVTATLEAEFESRERFLGFCRAVRGLPPQCRRVFVLRKVYGLSQREIAEYLQISESTVEKHVVKGLLICREAMRETGHLRDNETKRPRAVDAKRTKHG